MRRLHAPTTATTLGVGGVLIASMIYFAVFEHHLSFHELLITTFLLITAPITAKRLLQGRISIGMLSPVINQMSIMSEFETAMQPFVQSCVL